MAKKSDALRFWEKVDIDYDPLACWNWKPPPRWDGYGRFWLGGRNIQAHVYSYLLEHTELTPRGHEVIPPGMVVKHNCDNRSCVNPNHLSLDTQSNNMKDAVARGRHRNSRKTHCIKGHPFQPLVEGETRRRCACRKAKTPA